METEGATALSATVTRRECSRMVASERRTGARATEIARRRDRSTQGSPENLRLQEVKLSELDIETVPMAEVVPQPETEQTLDFLAGLKAALSEEEKKEWKSDMEKIPKR